MERIDTGDGLSVLDGGALVMGSAIASIHVLRIMREELSAGGWIMICLVFGGVTLTAAGPFVFLARRFARREPAYPKIGDRLWALLGIPWLASAVLKSARQRNGDSSAGTAAPYHRGSSASPDGDFLSAAAVRWCASIAAAAAKVCPTARRFRLSVDRLKPWQESRATTQPRQGGADEGANNNKCSRRNPISRRTPPAPGSRSARPAGSSTPAQWRAAPRSLVEGEDAIRALFARRREGHDKAGHGEEHHASGGSAMAESDPETPDTPGDARLV